MGNEKSTAVKSHSVDPITMMLEMRKEFKNMKRKSVKEINVLKAENEMIK